MTLDRTSAEQAIRERIAGPLSLSTDEAALAIVQVANANMADAVRLISIRRYDPREFALVVFGGAGALHGAALARLSIPTVLVCRRTRGSRPLGCLLVDVRHDLATMFLARADTVHPGDVEREFAVLEAEGRAARARGRPGGADEPQRFIDMRYLGQWRSLAVPVAAPLDIDAARRVPRRARAGAQLPARRIAGRDLPPHAPRRGSDAEAGARASRPKRLAAWTRWGYVRRFDELDAPVETPVYSRFDVPAGASLEGPAVLEQLDSTVLVPPGVRAEVDNWLNVSMFIEEVSR